MNKMEILSQIREASELEGQTLLLYSGLETSFQRNQMHLSENVMEEIYEFTFDYIRHVPEILEMMYYRAQNKGITQFIQPILDFLQNQFLSDKVFGPDRAGLLNLLDKAYITQCTIQGISDQYEIKTGKPLIPVPLKEANYFIRTIMEEKHGLALDAEVFSLLNSPVLKLNLENFHAHHQTFSMSGPDPVWGYLSPGQIVRSRINTLRATP